MKNGTKARKIPCWYARGVLEVNLRRILDTHEQTRDYDNKASRLEELVRKVGGEVADSTINRLLRSESGAGIDTIGHIAIALKVPLSDFLTDPSTEATKSPEVPTHGRHVSAITEEGPSKREKVGDGLRTKTGRKKKRHRR